MKAHLVAVVKGKCTASFQKSNNEMKFKKNKKQRAVAAAAVSATASALVAET